MLKSRHTLLFTPLSYTWSFHKFDWNSETCVENTWSVNKIMSTAVVKFYFRSRFHHKLVSVTTIVVVYLLCLSISVKTIWYVLVNQFPRQKTCARDTERCLSVKSRVKCWRIKEPFLLCQIHWREGRVTDIQSIKGVSFSLCFGLEIISRQDSFLLFLFKTFFIIIYLLFCRSGLRECVTVGHDWPQEKKRKRKTRIPGVLV